MKLIVGLGNPGRTYKYNRHNIGFLLIDRLSKNWRIKVKRDQRNRFRLGKGRVEDEEVILACPLCFMNLSGRCVELLLAKYCLNPQHMLVVFDDLDLRWGEIRIKPRGGSGGHKGVESIVKILGSSDFPRLRIGIGRPGQKKKVIDYVLSSWTQRERNKLGGYLGRAAECCKTWVLGGIERAMNEFN